MKEEKANTETQGEKRRYSKLGTLFKVNQLSHGWNGQLVILYDPWTSQPHQANVRLHSSSTSGAQWVLKSNLILIESSAAKQVLIDERDEYLEAARVADNKIKFLDETGSKTFVPNEFKAWTALSLMEDPKKTKAEKSKILAGLMS